MSRARACVCVCVCVCVRVGACVAAIGVVGVAAVVVAAAPAAVGVAASVVVVVVVLNVVVVVVVALNSSPGALPLCSALPPRAATPRCGCAAGRMYRRTGGVYIVDPEHPKAGGPDALISASASRRALLSQQHDVSTNPTLQLLAESPPPSRSRKTTTTFASYNTSYQTRPPSPPWQPQSPPVSKRYSKPFASCTLTATYPHVPMLVPMRPNPDGPAPAPPATSKTSMEEPAEPGMEPDITENTVPIATRMRDAESSCELAGVRRRCWHLERFWEEVHRAMLQIALQQAP